jgi:HSP20 family protein
MFDLIPWRKRYSKDLMMGFKNEMDNLFNHFFDVDVPFSDQMKNGGQWAPRIDVSEGDKEITVQVEIPGCDTKDVEVSIDGRILTIKGEKKHEKEEKEKNYVRVERTHGFFSRTLELPTEVDQKDVDATYKKGVLKIVLKKTATEDSKKIEIKTSCMHKDYH